MWRYCGVAAILAIGVAVSPTNSVAQSSSFERGIDRPGLDYSNFPLRDPSADICQDACLGDARCRAWTYVRPGVQSERARCWLKSARPEPRDDECCTSGVIRR